MQFSQVIGQNAYKQRMIESVKQDRISHAQLLVASEGAGALSLAIAYAQYINCTNRQEHDSCGECPSCKKFAKLVHPDLHFVFPVATTAKVKNPVSDSFIAEWRDIVISRPYFGYQDWLAHIGIENKQASIAKTESSEIIKKLNLKTYEGEYKVMIIWMAEKMNETCANKLLKIIEEPPAKTVFILIAENTEFILQTILSRTQMTKLPKIDRESMQAALSERYEFSSEMIASLVHNASGNFNKAVQLAESDTGNAEFFEAFTSLMRLCYTKKVPELMDLSDMLAFWGRERQKAFIEYGLKMIRENFILNKQVDQAVYLFGEESDFSRKFSAFITEKNIMGLTKEFNDAHYHIERNGNARIIFFDLCLKTIFLLKQAQ